jgi:hypothetical protein
MTALEGTLIITLAANITATIILYMRITDLRRNLRNCRNEKVEEAIFGLLKDRVFKVEQKSSLLLQKLGLVFIESNSNKAKLETKYVKENGDDTNQ